MKSISEIKATGKLSLKGDWGKFVLITLLIEIIQTITNMPLTLSNFISEFYSLYSFFSWIIYFFIVLLLFNLTWGNQVIYLRKYRKEEVEIDNVFDGYRKGFLRIFSTYFLVYIYTLLWSLLLIIPGIIKSLSYALTGYILLDNPELSRNQAIRRSRLMMHGNKAKLFFLQLSFLGWGILCLFTLGIGFLWLFPYMNSSFAVFYTEVKEEYLNNPQI